MSVFDVLKKWNITKYTVLKAEDIEAINLGSSILATGGGGDPEIGFLFAKRVMAMGKDFIMVDPMDVPDEALGACPGCLGAPVVLTEKPLSEEVLIDTTKSLEKYLGKPLDFCIPVECGGINSILAYVVAALLEIPVVDTDGMNRAFPELQMTSFSTHGVAATPLASGDNGGIVTIIDAKGDDLLAEDIARKTAMAYGGISWITTYPMNGKQLKESGVLNSQTIAWEIGKAVLKSRKNHLRPIREIQRVVKEVRNVTCYEAFEGKIVDIKREFGSEINKGFSMGKIIMEGINSYKGKEAKLDFQNEWLILHIDGEIKCLPPDLIAILDTDTGEPIRTDIMKYGYRGTIIVMPVHERMRTETGFKTFGPRNFGYDIDYVPVEELYEEK